MRTGWAIARASVASTSHGKTGLPCQDASDHLVVGSADDEILVCVVCDGAGSAAHSDVGSTLAAQTFIELVPRGFSSKRPACDFTAQRRAVAGLNDANLPCFQPALPF